MINVAKRDARYFELKSVLAHEEQLNFKLLQALEERAQAFICSIITRLRFFRSERYSTAVAIIMFDLKVTSTKGLVAILNSVYMGYLPVFDDLFGLAVVRPPCEQQVSGSILGRIDVSVMNLNI